MLARAWPAATGVLLDSQQRRGAFLTQAVIDLGLDDRIRVVTARAEDAARDPNLRGTIALVVARSFGPPAVTAECAVGFLAPDGLLAVSEPPDADPTARWPTAPLAELGLTPPEIRHANTTTIARSHHPPDPTPDRFPKTPAHPCAHAPLSGTFRPFHASHRDPCRLERTTAPLEVEPAASAATPTCPRPATRAQVGFRSSERLRRADETQVEDPTEPKAREQGLDGGRRCSDRSCARPERRRDVPRGTAKA